MKTYFNPILSGFYPDPSICRVGKDYYLVNSTFAYFPGIPIFQSPNLVEWNLIGHVLNRPGQLDLTGFGVSKGIFAPSIRYHQHIFYVTCTLIDGKGNFVVTATDPSGPWSDPIWLPHVEGIDPSLFFDQDKAWLIYNSTAPGNRPLYNGHRTIRMQHFDIANLSTNGNEIILINGGIDIKKNPRWIEGPHLIKKNNYYFLIAAEGGTGYDHSVVAFRSKSIDGPYEAYPHNPVLSQRNITSSKQQITSTGHADLVETFSGEWYAVFLGCRPYEGDHYNTGRETFMVPVTWTNDWPLLNQGHDEVLIQYPVPHPEIYSDNSMSLNGNFSIRDEFKKPVLDSQWMFLRTPKEKWLKLEHGKLIMQVRTDTCSGLGNPSFIARRQQHMKCTATCSLSFTPAVSHEKAGLCIFQDENHFYFLCLSVVGQKMVVELFKSVMLPANGNRMHLLHTAAIEIKIPSPLQLRIMGDHQHYSFYYRTDNDDWTLIADCIDAKFLSTRTAGGFVGCTFALYATSMGKPSNNTVTYHWFEYSGDDELFY